MSDDIRAAGDQKSKKGLPEGLNSPATSLQLNKIDVERIVRGKTFGKADRMANFLRFLVEHGRSGDGRRLKETEIGSAVYGRDVGYDPKADSIVRVEATRLRKKLALYYETEGAGEPLWLHLPPGKYELEVLDRPTAADTVPPASIPRWWAATLGVLLVAALGMGAWILRRSPGGGAILEGQVVTSMPGHEDTPAVTRDGAMVAYTWDGKTGEKAIYIQAIGEESGKKLTPHGRREGSPVWGRDGRELAYLGWTEPGRAELRIRELASGKEEKVAEVNAEEGETPGLGWSPDGRWLVTGESRDLVLFDRQTGGRRTFLGGAGARSNPVFSPDARRLAYVQSEEAASGDVWVVDFPAGTPRRVTHDRTLVRGISWMGSEALLVASYRERGRSAIWKVDVETGRMERWTEAPSENRYPAFAQGTGQVVWARHVGNVHIWKRGGDWTQPGEEWIRATGLNSSPQFSPEGKRVALRSNRSGRSEIWVVETDTGKARRLTNLNGPVTGSPRWSPDGQRIAFDSRVHGTADVFVVSAQGGPLERMTNGESNEVVPAWSADGRWLYYGSDREGAWGLWRKELATGKEEKVRSGAFGAAEFGRYLYFSGGPKQGGLYRMERDSGQVEVVVGDLRASMWGNWAVGPQGVVYVQEDGKGNMQLMRWREGTQEAIGPANGVVRWDGGLALAPDGRTLLLSQLSGGDSDLYVSRAVRR